jgi:hypothetical protein
MNSKSTTVRFEHRLAKPFSYYFYSRSTLPVGMVVLKSKGPEKPEDGYKFVMGHGSSLLIPAGYVEVYQITRTVEETEIALQENA